MSRRLELLRRARVGDASAVLERLNLLRESAYYRRLDETGRRRLQAAALAAPGDRRRR